MPTCENCHNKWTWKTTMRKMFTSLSGMTCPHCGEKQFQTRKSKMNSGFLNVLILLPLMLKIFFDIPVFILYSSFPVLFVLAISLLPFLINLSSKEENIIPSEE